MCLIAWSLIPVGIDNVPVFLAVGALAAVLSAMAKAGFGGSIGMLATPLMIFACGQKPVLALGVMLPLLIVIDYVAMVSWWGQWNWRAVVLLLPGVVLGIALGAAALAVFRQEQFQAHKGLADGLLMLFIGAVALGFVALQIVRSLRRDPVRFRPVLWQATSVGALAGFTSTLAHAAGPIVTMYLLPQRMPKERFVATTALYYWIGNQLKLVPYFALAMVNTSTLGSAIVFLPALVGGALLGVFLHHRVGERQFIGIVHVLIALAGVELVRNGAMKLWS